MKKLTTLILFLLAFYGGELYSQYANTRLHPSGIVNQIEPFIVRHPANQQVLFASAYTIWQNFRSEGIYVSTDGGNSWRGNDTNTGAPINNHGGDPGPLIDKNGVFIVTHQPGQVSGMHANFSTNQGLTWSGSYPIFQGSDVDKGYSGTDDAPASAYYGRSYLAWTRYSPPYPIVISYTGNSGVNWSAYIQINNSYGSNRSFGPSMAVNPSGTLFVVWASSIPNSPFTEDCIGVGRSANGGLNWNVNECAIDCNGIRTSQLTPWTIRANSYPLIDIDKTGGSRNGWVYIVVTNKNLAPAGSDPDVVLHRSTDNGNTWSPGVRVNQDPLNNGRNQFFPCIRVDEGGGVNVIYYDSRNSVDSVDVYLSRSENGGINWVDQRITNQRFRPAPVAGISGNMGDNMGLTSGSGKLYPVWMSNITGILQVWTAVIDYSVFGINKIGNEIPSAFNLEQNYPNPFNPATKIKFDVPEKMSSIKIVVYDINGKEIRTLVDQQLSPGTYETDFDASGLSSGMYFYRLITEGFAESKKMILVK